LASAIGYTTRRRKYAPKKIFGTLYRLRDSDGKKTNISPFDEGTQYTGTQTTVSRGNPWPPKKGGFHGAVGGDFTTTKSYVESKIPKQRLKGKHNDANLYTPMYEGGVCTSPLGGGAISWPSDISSSDSELNVIGATAVARCKPTNSIANVTVFLGELLHEGLPRVQASRDWLRATTAARAAGDDYLNAAFGWKPIQNDIQNIVQAIGATDSALAQFQRDSGRLVRRRYQFPTETSSSDTTLTFDSGYVPGFGPVSDFLETSGTRIRTVETERRKWFSGAFTYYMPDDLKGSSFITKLRAEAELSFGLALTPENVWNLAPWSWAVDWFSNTGDVLSNISDANRYGLIMPYGYVMEHSINKHTYSLKGSKFWNSQRGVPSITLVTEVKKRRQANPFGFGVQWSGLDSFQLSILAALGLSRSR